MSKSKWRTNNGKHSQHAFVYTLLRFHIKHTIWKYNRKIEQTFSYARSLHRYFWHFYLHHMRSTRTWTHWSIIFQRWFCATSNFMFEHRTRSALFLEIGHWVRCFSIMTRILFGRFWSNFFHKKKKKKIQIIEFNRSFLFIVLLTDILHFQLTHATEGPAKSAMRHMLYEVITLNSTSFITYFCLIFEGTCLIKSFYFSSFAFISYSPLNMERL